jgi:NADPH:quinone reductase-like Zn-dependent oxidoreductase
MKAVVTQRYGPPDEVLRIEDVDMPTPGDDDVLVRTHATSANPADWHLIRGVPQIARLQIGLRRPKHSVMGCDVAGRVEAVGANVTGFHQGDEVFGEAFPECGAFAEYVRLPAAHVVPKPASLSFEQAAAIPLAATTALQGLRDRGHISQGQHVLIVGASGGVGHFAVQIAKALGAEVTAVCRTRNLDLVRELGADHAIDHTAEDFTAGEVRYDVILQVAGTTPPSACRRVLTPQGTLVLISGDSPGRLVGPVGRIVKALVMDPFVGQKLKALNAKPNQPDLQALVRLVEEGRLAPVIDRTYPLDEVPEALRYLEQGHARGKVAITV